MANSEHLSKLLEGSRAWNQWRIESPKIIPDLRGADFKEANLRLANLREADLFEASFFGAKIDGADLRAANLIRANLNGASLRGADLRSVDLIEGHLCGADFCGADLRGAKLMNANLNRAILQQVDLREAALMWANLSEVQADHSQFEKANFHGADVSGADLNVSDLGEANLSCANFNGANLRNTRLTLSNLRGASLNGADLRGARLRWADMSRVNAQGANFQDADLSGTTLIRTQLGGANLTGCTVFGVSVWGANLEGAIQSNLIITSEDDCPIQVDNLEVAQFVYLLLNNQRIRAVIDTITSKMVLILGRFTPTRKVVLDVIRDELRTRHYLPVLFDFEKPSSQTTVETISTLAHLAKFVIADLTDAKSILQELQAIVPLSPSVVVQPVILASQEEPGMFDFIRKFPWVLNSYRYEDQATILRELGAGVIAPAEAKVKELREQMDHGRARGLA